MVNHDHLSELCIDVAVNHKDSNWQEDVDPILNDWEGSLFSRDSLQIGVIFPVYDYVYVSVKYEGELVYHLGVYYDYADDLYIEKRDIKLEIYHPGIWEQQIEQEHKDMFENAPINENQAD